MNRLPRLLVCPPTYYRVAYEINPWMNLRRQPLTALTDRQWRGLVAVLRDRAWVEEVKPLSGAPDMAFTANAGFVLDGRVLASRFRYQERRGEESHFRAWFEATGLEVIDCPRDVCFEGEGDALRQPGGGRIWLGHGFRSDAASAGLLQRAFGEEIVPLRLILPRFYHLDTCFCPLPGSAVLYYPDALAPESRLRLYRLVPPEHRIEVGREDAETFACNALLLGSALLLNRASATLCSRLERRGLEVIQCPVSEFLRAGGAVKCLTLRLD